MSLSILSFVVHLLSSSTMLPILALAILAIALSYLYFFSCKKNIIDIFSAIITTIITATINTNIDSVDPLPPSPLKIPIIGNLHQLGPLPHRSFRALSDRHGPLMLLHIGRFPVLIISSHSIVREITKTQDHLFANRPSLIVPNMLFYHGRGISFSSYNECWREAKKATIVHLLSKTKVGSYKQVREEEVALMMKEIEQTMVANMTERFNLLSMDVISRMIIGEPTKSSWWGDELRGLINENMRLLGELYIGDFMPWLGKIVGLVSGFERRVRLVFQRSDQLLERINEEHRNGVEKRKEVGGDENKANKPFLDLLLTIEEELKCKGVDFNGDSIKSIIKEKLGAGTDSVSSSMDWTMAELLRHPTAMKKLREEITKVVGPNKTFIEEEQLAEMSYLKAVVKEALRLHPPNTTAAPRQITTQGVHLNGYRIPEGTLVIINAWAIGRDPAVWDSPDEFRPERFIDGEARDINFINHGFQLLAFGAGRRSCPGSLFSVALIELAIANLVYAFDWKPTKGKLEDIDMGEDFGLITRKREALLLVATRAIK